MKEGEVRQNNWRKIKKVRGMSAREVSSTFLVNEGKVGKMRVNSVNESRRIKV